jgi:hypothetical protein
MDVTDGQTNTNTDTQLCTSEVLTAVNYEVCLLLGSVANVSKEHTAPPKAYANKVSLKRRYTSS